MEDPERWEREQAEVAEWFPGSESFDETLGTETFRCWHALIQPVSPETEVELVIADLDRDGAVDVSRHGTLLHSRTCRAEHRMRPPLQSLEIPAEVFLVKALYRAPPAHPVVWPVSPEISSNLYPGHPHFFAGGALCPLLPKDRTWRWKTHTICDYLMQVALWLFKSRVWISTKQRTGDGIWIGSDVDHSAENLLAIIQPEDECCCGSAKRYKKCCRPRHLKEAVATRQRALELM